MSTKEARPPQPPQKPYTEYTIFFRLECMYILQSNGGIDDEIKASLNREHHDPIEHPRPAKYKDIILPPFWYCIATKDAAEKKRKHRKREGRVGLKALSKMISAAWPNIDEETAIYCKKLAQVERKKYEEALAKFEEKRKQPNAILSNDNTGDNANVNAIGYRVSKIPAHSNFNSMNPFAFSRRNRVNFINNLTMQEGYQAFLSQLEMSASIPNSQQNINVTKSTASIDMGLLQKRRLLCRSTSTYGISPNNTNRSCNENSDIHAMKQIATFACVPDWQVKDAITLINVLFDTD